jgi:hypothetical protein
MQRISAFDFKTRMISMIFLDFYFKLTAQTTIAEMKSYGQAGQVAEEAFTAFRTITAFNAQNREQIR